MKNYLNQRVNTNQFNPQYLIIDTECLYDYWSFQYRNESMKTTEIIEIQSDKEFHDFYNDVLINITRPMYFYSIDYDSVMINMLCKLIEKGYTNINHHMRTINNMIMRKLDYMKVNTTFWCDFFFKSCEGDFELSIQKTKHHYNSNPVNEFLDQYSDLLGKSKVFKELMFCSIPKMMYYYTIKQDRTLIPSISLKKLQLVEEGLNLYFDFGKYDNIESIKNDGCYDTWLEYCRNDVDFLYRFFNKHLLKKVKEKWLAVKAVNSIEEKVIENKVIYAENNTSLIVEVLKIDNPKKDIVVDYTKYINTDNEKFNNFVKFVNENQHIKTDRDLKKAYSDHMKIEYIDDDYNHDEDIQINSFDHIKLRNCDCNFGLGGLHGAVPNVTADNLLHLDYRSQYPSIILQYPELFKSIINIELYRTIYDQRNFVVKLEIGKIKKEIKKLCDKIEQGGNDGGDIADFGPVIEQLEKELEELEGFYTGLKLILNMSYGLINSNFNLPISSKILGRFICLKGQSLLINLADRIPQDSIIYNVNTDGIIIKTDTEFNIEDDGYFALGVDKINAIIQKAVNDYIKIISGKTKTKGVFNVRIKNKINKNEKLGQNLINAVNLISGKEVKTLPIYFNAKTFNVENKAYYLTTEEYGSKIIKEVKQPQILGLAGDIFYFTTDPEKACWEMYNKYAKITKDRIFDFELEKKEVIKYYEIELINDSDENIVLKRQTRRKLMKLLNKCIGISGLYNNLKTDCLFYNAGKQYINKPLIQYNMTQILSSTIGTGLTVNSVDNDLIIIDIDIYDKKTGKPKPGWNKIKPLLDQLKGVETFQCWNKKTKSMNRKYIFRNPGNIDINVESKYFELINKGVVWSIDGFYSNNEIEAIDLPENIINLLKCYS